MERIDNLHLSKEEQALLRAFNKLSEKDAAAVLAFLKAQLERESPPDEPRDSRPA